MSTDTEKAEALQEIGKSAYASILEMVNALECDYERLAELREEREAILPDPTDDWDAENGLELLDLIQAATLDGTECESREDAEQRIQEDPLSIEVRSGWVTLGSNRGELEPEEFNILLSTGGPAVRIMGELRGGEPYRAWLEVQDWFTPWTQYFGTPDPKFLGQALTSVPSQDVLLTYARCFYFGG